MTIYWLKKTIGFSSRKETTKKGWRHHATSTFWVYNSKHILSQNSQPPQGSQSVETWRTWIQHILHIKYNWPVRFLRLNTLFLITWWVPEKGKGGKSLVPRNDNLKGEKWNIFKSVDTPNPVTGHTNNRAWSKRDTAKAQITTLT